MSDSGSPTKPTSEPASQSAEQSSGQSSGQSSAAAETRDPLRGSRTSGLWFAVVSSGVVLVLLIIFIAQNTESVRITFLSWEGEAPLAVALLAATVAGLFLAAIAGTMRIWQLRRRVRRESR
ncbi:lipopolysaccharide assembly protein LapA domain-containing protein [Nocardioides coralli]|uniref:lipopolysaccharide assembly protein LapA domain-containing protein n=1 Tax=Nocardioides coralli TaxID=2872154 RepID=UPI001CA3CD3B|nr:lipopolysaccharide assembly protein LapA domain-containing protein [Nocardioides coralli]QZY27872.1 lipopolysaccharide assembly protein LapA domain-containing protein [Nocardioides coralli]